MSNTLSLPPPASPASMPSAPLPAVPARMRRSLRPVYWLSAAIVLLALQLLSGTLPLYAFLVFAFAGLTYLAVKAAGGLDTLMGACVFFMAMQNVLISQAAKVYFWQPGDSRLIWPVETMGIYCVAMAGIGLAGYVSRRLGFLTRRPLFETELNPQRLMWMAYIGTGLSVFQMVYGHTSSVDSETGAQASGGIHGLVMAMSFLTPLAVAAGTAFIILASKGRRSLGVVNSVAIAVPLVFGIIGAGREAMVTAIVIYFVTCWVFRFRFRPIHYAVLLGGAYVMQFILFPYALYARNFVRTKDAAANVTKAFALLGDVIANPLEYQEKAIGKHGSHRKFLYYATPMPTLDRASTIVIADGIVDATMRNGTTEMDTITPGFLMTVPRILLPDKPYNANALARREPGMVNKKDKGTGITTGFICDTFSSFGWPGAFLISFLLSLGMFCAYRFVINDRLYMNVYALSLLFHLPWVFSGAPIASLIVTIFQGSIVLAAILFVDNRLINFATLSQLRIQAARQRAIFTPPAADRPRMETIP